MSQVTTPQSALKKLVDGNARFVSGLRSVASIAAVGKREELAEKGQKPFAVILSCSDARVPAEMVFDTGLGDLFVVRVAGNIVAPSLLGSIEFAVAKFDTPLIVVMGHTRCGAIAAACASQVRSQDLISPSIEEIVSRIEPSILTLKKAYPNLASDHPEFVERVTWGNIQLSVETVQGSSELLKKKIDQQTVGIVSACYNLETGAVEFRNVPAYARQGIASTPAFGPEVSSYFVRS